MKLEIYPNTNEEEYDIMTERLNMLADALANVQPGRNLPKAIEDKIGSWDIIHFLKKLIYKITY
ncbi:hypothetical protein [Adhaeribacter pallidiroseus]|uniref:Uncharacterized protein n=1 Tax=Adhaeribacter pallidiroseus TaxID=2072847 RepID=A0A369QGE8_9BACT|nr:hypothetical protein [Adhaeribacter pallidiroseus]RDC62306.1 hypothetical protein AHMF7616_00899 [Adhaeribacter pallidiroseus]